MQPDYAKFYRSLYLIRRTEEEIARIYPSDKIKSPIHLSIGQEAVSVGVCQALAATDVVFGTYRSHAMYLAKGGCLKSMMAELFGKLTGCARGKGGSMHLIDVSKGVMGTSAVVATTIPEAVGYAYAAKLKDTKEVVVSFFGDGAIEEGVFHESLNFASLKKLPIIFVCENNSYAIHTHKTQRQAIGELCDFARVYGVQSDVVNNNDSLVIYDRVSRAAEAMRAGSSSPLFLECHTYRWREHVGPNEDFHLGYREQQESQAWIDNDELRRIAGFLDPSIRHQLETEVEETIREAIDFAESSPFPNQSDLFDGVYKQSNKRVSCALPDADGREVSFADAVREALDSELQRDSNVVVYGLDVDDPKAILGTTRGLVEKYGESRVFGTPLSEDAMTGAGIGMALAGLRPVHVHIRMDFLMLALNQLLNMAAKSHYMFGNQVHVPMVVRAMIGKSWGQGAQHSQALHSFFMHVPGIKVVAPSTPFDAKGTLIAAIKDENPVVFVEHRLLHYQTGPVPEESYELLPGSARIAVAGSDITIVGISYMQTECIKAQRYLAEIGIQAEVIDPIWLQPFDFETVIGSVAKTRRLLIVDNAWLNCGASAEIAARTVEALGGDHTLKIRRMGFAATTCPTSPPLEECFYPNARSIASTAYAMVHPDRKTWMPDIEEELETAVFKGPF